MIRICEYCGAQHEISKLPDDVKDIIPVLEEELDRTHFRTQWISTATLLGIINVPFFSRGKQDEDKLFAAMTNLGWKPTTGYIGPIKAEGFARGEENA